MGNPCRCPVCNTFGSSRLNGYCKKHVPMPVHKEDKKVIPNSVVQVPDENDPGYMVRNNFKPDYGFPRGKAFWGKEFAAIDKKYGLQKKGYGKR